MEYNYNQPSVMVINNLEVTRLRIRLARHLFSILNKRTGNALKALKYIRHIKTKYQTIFGEPLLTKVAKVDNLYYWRLSTPGFPSLANSRMHEYEVNHLLPSVNGIG